MIMAFLGSVSRQELLQCAVPNGQSLLQYICFSSNYLRCLSRVDHGTNERRKQAIYPCQGIYVARSIIRKCIAFSMSISFKFIQKYRIMINEAQHSTVQHGGIHCLLHRLVHDYVALEKKKESDSDTSEGTKEWTRKTQYGTVSLSGICVCSENPVTELARNTKAVGK